MASDHVSSDPLRQCQRTALEHDSLSPGTQCQDNVTHADKTVTTSNELDLLSGLMFDDLLNGSSQVVSKSSADAPNQCQKQNTTPLNNQTTRVPTSQVPTQEPTITSTKNINQAEMIAENAQMASDHVSSDPLRQCQRTALEHDSLSPGTQCQDNVTHADKTVTTSNELDLLSGLMFDDLLNGSSQVVSKSSAVTTADAPNQCQKQNTTPLNNQTTRVPTSQVPTQEPTVTSTKNINQAEMIAENAQVANDEFINIFCTPVQDREETSSRHVDSSNMHTFYQWHPSEHRWMKDHLLKQVIGNPSQSVRTRCQLESNGEMCMFALTVSRTEPKNIKESMVDSAWIESMQEELHQFDRLDVWELVD
nr:hypothetical protein [Tanacetum cinerariifolium]